MALFSSTKSISQDKINSHLVNFVWGTITAAVYKNESYFDIQCNSGKDICNNMF